MKKKMMMIGNGMNEKKVNVYVKQVELCNKMSECGSIV
jgi:hypothetical protein